MANDDEKRALKLEDFFDEPGGFLDGWIGKIIAAAIVIVLAGICAFPVADHFSNPETYQGTIEALNDSQEVATGFALSTAAASTVITVAGPDDWGNGVANELADISGGFAIVLAAILLEKNCVVLIGLLAFRYLIPIALVLMAIGFLLRRGSAAKGWLFTIGPKIIFFSLALVIAIPFAVHASGLIEQAYNQGEENRLEQMHDDLDAFAGVASAVQEEQGIIDKLKKAGSSLVEGVNNLPDLATNLVAGTVEAFAMMIVLNCIVPILVVVLLLWFASTILGARIPMPKGMPRVGSKARKRLMGVKE